MKSLVALLLCGALAAPLAADSIPLKKDFLKKSAGDVGTLMEEDGLTAIELKGTTVANTVTKGNKYFNFNFDLPEAQDFTGKALKIRAKSDTPEVRGLYIRAFNKDNLKAPVWSFQTWRPNTLKSDYTEIILIPGENGQLDWEKAVTTGAEPTQVSRLQFHIASPKELTPINLKIKSIEVIDNPRKAYEQFLAPIGKFAQLSRSTFAQNPTVNAEIKDGAAVLRCEGRSQAESKQMNQYEGVQLQLAAPVNMLGKTLKFDVKFTGKTTVLYVRAFAKGVKAPVLSFVSLRALPQEWTPVELTAGTKTATFGCEGKAVCADVKADKVSTLDFIFCTNQKDAPFGIEIRNLRAE